METTTRSRESVFLDSASEVHAKSFGSPLLVLIPHADDEVLGLGGLLQQLVSLGAEVDLVLVTDGSASHLASKDYTAEDRRDVREAEFIESLRLLGVEKGRCEFWRKPDSQLPHLSALERESCLEELEQQLVSKTYATVITPWRRDPHGDHQEITRWVFDILRGKHLGYSPRVAEYFVWLGLQGDQSDYPSSEVGALVKLDVRKHALRKSQALSVHASQFGHVFNDPTGFVIPADLANSTLRDFEYFFISTL